MLTTVEKVLFLQDVDIFEFTKTEDLSHIASITDEIELEHDTVIFREGEIPDAMYIVSEGKVKMTRAGEEVMIAEHKNVFGTWALFDDEPRVATATAQDTVRLLRVDREDFIDLLADHMAITQSILKALAKRLRQLMTRVSRQA